MRVSVTGRHVRVTESMDHYAREKVDKLPKYYDRIQSIEVLFDQGSAENKVEIIVETDHRNTFVASESGEDMYATMDMVVDKMKSQLTRHKEKHRNRKHLGKRVDKTPEV